MGIENMEKTKVKKDEVSFDNLLRRKLRVSDPKNPDEIAKALANLYPLEKKVIDQEAKGMPLTTEAIPVMAASAGRSIDTELEEAKSDVDQDLKALQTHPLLKEIVPEINGWAIVIKKAISDGASAAPFALDPVQRSKTLAARRFLGDYARMSRLVGAMTPTLNLSFRYLARSLDEIAAILLVMMGESLANLGFSGGEMILNVPITEIQERRDSVLYALRNLVGSAQEAYGPDEWPRGLYAYKQFIERIDKNAQHDLKPLFIESELANMMDELIRLASAWTEEGLRQLTSTAQVTLERFRRLRYLGQDVADPESPALASFLLSIEMFLDSFKKSVDPKRLLAIARPPILSYGLYKRDEVGDALNQLTCLIRNRGRLAKELDCFMGCKCDQDAAECQIILDKILYDVDRAIDLYAFGNEDFGEPEQRAVAYGYIIDAVLNPFRKKRNAKKAKTQFCLRRPLVAILNEMKNVLHKHIKELSDKGKELIHQEFCSQEQVEKKWISFVQNMVPDCIDLNVLEESIEKIIKTARENAGLNEKCLELKLDIPDNSDRSLEKIANKT